MPTSSLTGQPIGTLRGAAPQGGAGTYGKVPQVPDPTQSQLGAIQGQMGNLGQLYVLTGSLNTEIANQAVLPYNLNLPQYQGMVGQSSKNILSQLQGQVPQDVANQISQMAAERGVSTGSIGSPNANTALLRSLGLTSLNLQQQGEQNLSGAVARTPTGQQFNPQSFLVTPQQMQEAQYLANLYSAAPTPGAGDRANLNALQQGLGGIGGAGGARGGVSNPNADYFGNVYNPNSGDPGTFAYGANVNSSPILAGAGGVLPGGIPGSVGGGAGYSTAPVTYMGGADANSPYGAPPAGSGNSNYFSQFGGQSDPWMNQFNNLWDQGTDIGGGIQTPGPSGPMLGQGQPDLESMFFDMGG